jgi:hypothetical protein
MAARKTEPRRATPGDAIVESSRLRDSRAILNFILNSDFLKAAV